MNSGQNSGSITSFGCPLSRASASGPEQALRKVLHRNGPPERPRIGYRRPQIRQNIQVAGDQVLVVVLPHRPVGPEFHLRQSPQVGETLHHRGQLPVAAAGHHRVRQRHDTRKPVQILKPGQRAIERSRDPGDRVVSCGVGGRHADKIFVDPRRDQLAAIRRIGQLHPMRLDAHVLEPRGPDMARQIGQIAPQRHLGARQCQPLPLPGPRILGADAGQLLIRTPAAASPSSLRSCNARSRGCI